MANEISALYTEIRALLKDSYRSDSVPVLHTIGIGLPNTVTPYTLPERVYSLQYRPTPGTVYLMPQSCWSGAALALINAGGMVTLGGGRGMFMDLSQAQFFVRDTGSGTTLSLWIISHPS